MFDLSDVTFVKRITLGSAHPEAIQPEEALEDAAALLNRCLSDHPRGKIINLEKSFTLLNIGEHQVVLQWACYHVGFPRKPLWLEDRPASASSHAPSPRHHGGMPPT
ncbi:MAG: hypothetical protein ACRYFW_11435 [Janthinobacterium lividum]